MKEQKRVVIKCMDCNKPFSITEEKAGWYHLHGMELPKRCSECITKRRSTQTKKIVCKDCHKTFELDAANETWYKEHGLEEPVRCPACRAKRKKAKEEFAATGRVTLCK
jgi:DNA-directed RNA polymerase subunit RPC12/RpoP